MQKLSFPGREKILLWALLLTTGLLVVGADAMVVRFGILGNSNRCYYNLARTFPVQVDALLVGSSRVRRGVDPDQLALMLGKQSSPAAVVNFGRPGGQPALDAILVDMLTQNSEVGLILVEANLAAGPPPDGRNNTRAFATYRQLAIQELRKPQGIVLRLYALAQETKLKIQGAVKVVLTGRALNVLLGFRGERMDEKRRNICWMRRWNDPRFDKSLPGHDQKKEALKSAFEAKGLDWFADKDARLDTFEDENKKVNVDAWRKIVEIGRERGARIVFFYLPDYYVWSPPADFRAKFLAEVHAPIIFPGKGLLRELQDGGYLDHGHLTTAGRARFTAWLGTALNELAGDNP